MNTIDSVIIHKLVKDRQGKASVTIRPTLLPKTPLVEKLVHDIHEQYANRPSKGYGRFEADETNYPLSRILREVFKDKKKTFLAASTELMTILAAKAGQAPLATGGYVIMAKVTNPAQISWFIVAILTNMKGSAIKDDSLDVIDSVYVDFQNLRVAGRVDLSKWLANDTEARYIGFLKQHGNVADYFKLFLGCNDLIGSREETSKLVKAIKGFARTTGLERERQDALYQVAYNYCFQSYKENQPLSLEALSNVLWPDDPRKFQQALTAEDVQVNDGFVPDKSSLKAFTKIKGRTSYWSIELDRKALVTRQAIYDPEKRTLTLSDLPEDLEEDLKNELSNGSV